MIAEIEDAVVVDEPALRADGLKFSNTLSCMQSSDGSQLLTSLVSRCQIALSSQPPQLAVIRWLGPPNLCGLQSSDAMRLY